MFPLVYKPNVGILFAIAVGLVWLASRSIAWPVGLAGAPTVLTAVLGHNPLPAKAPTVGIAAWTLLGIAFVLSRTNLSPAGALLTAAPIASVALAVLLIVRSSASLVPVYGSLKVQLFLAVNVIALVAGVFVGRNSRAFSLVALLWIVLAAITALALARGLAAGQVDVAVGGRVSIDAQNGPIGLGRNAARGILVAVAFLLTSRRGGRQVLAFATLPLIAVAFIASGSRGPVLGLVIGLAVLLVLTLRDRRARSRVVVVAFGAVLGAVMVTQLVPGQDVSRALSVLTGSEGGLSTNGRAGLLSAAWNAFVTHPLVGTGTGSFAALRPPELYPHNIFLEIASELGVVGLVLLIVVLAAGARAVWRSYATASAADRPQAALVAALFASAFVNAQFSGDVTTNSDLWLLIGLALGLQNRLRVDAVTSDVVQRMRTWRRSVGARGDRGSERRGPGGRSPWLQAPTPRGERSRGEIVVPPEGALVGGIVDVGGRPAETGWGVAAVHLEVSSDDGTTWIPVPHAAAVAVDVFRVLGGFREHVAVARTHRVADLLATELERLDEAADRYVTEISPRRPWQLGAGWSIEWDARHLDPGAYLLRALTLDVAGSRVATGPRGVRVDNAAAEALRASAPVPGAAELELRRRELETASEQLGARQRALVERESVNRRHEQDLAERERLVVQLEQLRADVAQRAEKLAADRTDLEERARVVAAEAAAAAKARETAQAAFDAVQARAAELADRGVELERREKAVARAAELAANVEQRERAVVEREQEVARLDVLRVELDERADALEAERAAATAERQSAQRALEAAQARSDELAARAADLAEREPVIAEAAALIADVERREKDVAQREQEVARLAALYADGERRSRELQARERQLEERLAATAVREAAAAKLAAELAIREREVAAQMPLAEELAACAADMERREAELERARANAEAAAAAAVEDRAAAERARADALDASGAAARLSDELQVEQQRLRTLALETEAAAREAAERATSAAGALEAAERRTRELDDRVKGLTSREQGLIRRTMDLGERERELDELQRRVEAARAQMDAELTGLQATGESLRARAYELERREAALGVPASGLPVPAPAPAAPGVDPAPPSEPAPPLPAAPQPPAPAVVVRPPVRAGVGFRLAALERSVSARPATDPYVQADREATLVALRAFVGIDGVIPPEFHAMVGDVFGELL